MYCNVTLTSQHQTFVYTQLNSSIWTVDPTLTGTTTLNLSGPGSNGNEGVLHILQGSRTGASPSEGLVSYLGHSLRESFPFAEM